MFKILFIGYELNKGYESSEYSELSDEELLIGDRPRSGTIELGDIEHTEDVLRGGYMEIKKDYLKLKKIYPI